MKLFVFFLFISMVSAVHVEIFTKNFAPFSFEGEGFSIDYLHEILVRTFGTNSLSTNIVVVSDNTAIFNSVLAYNSTSGNFSMGTAGISITPARVELGVFLPAFYREGGLRVMTHTQNSFEETVKRIISNFFLAFGLMILGVFVLVLFLFSLAWFSEFQFSGNEVPIFMDRDLRRKPRKITLYDVAECFQSCGCDNFTILTQKAHLVISEMLSAFMWVLYTLGGVKTGYPKSKGAQLIHSSCKFLAVLIVVVATATITTVFTKSSESTKINGFADLGSHTVCTTQGTTSLDFLTRRNFGYSILTKNSVSKMFDAFWNHECVAVVYDQPALQNALVDHGGGALIVGDFLTEDSYGIFMSPNNIHQNTLTKAVVELNTDTDKYNALKDKWLSDIKGKQGTTNIELPVLLFVLPVVIIIGVFILAIIPLYKGYEERTERYEEVIRAKHDTNYEDDYKELLKDEYDVHALWGNDWMLSERVGPVTKRALRVLYEMVLRSEGKDIHHIGKDSLPRRMSTFSIRKKSCEDSKEVEMNV